MHDATLATGQIRPGVRSRWRDVLPATKVAEFEVHCCNLLRELGYDLSGETSGTLEGAEKRICCTRGDADVPLAADVRLAAEFEVYLAKGGRLAANFDEVSFIWPHRAQSPTAVPVVTVSPHAAAVRLLAGGVTIPPMVSCEGTYSFVVPESATQVWLQSRSCALADPSAPYLGAARRLGVRVSEITIRTRAGESIIPADDPRLITGWHEAEQAGTGLWRWTDGSAELPWVGVKGPALVTIHCTALADYPAGNETYGMVL